MANINPRRKPSAGAVSKKPSAESAEAPWMLGDPGKRVPINIPLPEPLMIQLDYLVKHHAIYSKASFVRDVVSEAAERELNKLSRVKAAMRKMEAEEKARK